MLLSKQQGIENRSSKYSNQAVSPKSRSPNTKNYMPMKKIIIALIALIIIIAASTLYIKKWKSVNDVDKSITDSILIADFPGPPSRLYGFIEDSFIIERNFIGRNQNLASILLPHKIDYSAIHQLALNSNEVFDVRKIKSGNKYSLFFNKDSVKTPAYLVYEIDNTDYVVMGLTGENIVTRHQKPINTIRKTGEGIITSSLWNAMSQNNLNPMLAIELSEIYAWTVDFFGIEKGDNFKVIFDESYVEGTSIGISTVIAAKFIHREKIYYAFRYQEDSTMAMSFFDDKGLSLRKAFLKSPIKFARISSRFSHNRFHPILKISRPHHGVDYAAPQGTQVFSIGDGRVTNRGWDPKGGGNYIKITHNSVYSTVYMHLSGFADGVSKGGPVKQGQLIGYVGKTGLATGPHLDFRVYKNGSPVDPLKIEAPPVEPIKKENMTGYLEFIAALKSELDTPNTKSGY